MRTILIALVVALVAAGCGASEGIRDEGSQRVASPIADSGVPKRPVGIYLMRYGSLAKVTRFVSANDPKRGALEALLKGPTPQEARERYTSAIPAATGFSIFGPPTGSVSVDMFGGEQLDAILRTATSDDVDARRRQWLLRQIVYTMTEFSDVDNVEVTLNGASLPLGSTTPGSFLTRKIFDDDNRVAQWHDQTRCDGNQDPSGRGKGTPGAAGRRPITVSSPSRARRTRSAGGSWCSSSRIATWCGRSTGRCTTSRSTAARIRARSSRASWRCRSARPATPRSASRCAPTAATSSRASSRTTSRSGRPLRASAAVAALAVAALVTACGGGTSGGGATSDAAPPAASTQPAVTSPVTSTGTAPTAPATTVEGPSHDVTLWFVKDGKPASVTRKAPATPEVARQALELLFGGPTADEQAQGYSSQIVEGTQLNAIALRDRVATVDVSPDIQAVVPGAPDKGAADQLKLGQIVRTLTQLRDVAWVRFAVNGLEQTFPAPGAGLYAGLLNREIVDAGKDGPPWIQIETVEVDRENVHFAGSADVFEGALQARLVQNGKTLVESPVQASCGTGCRGSYVLDFGAPDGTTGKARLEVYSESPEDGSVDQIARRTVTLG